MVAILQEVGPLFPSFCCENQAVFFMRLRSLPFAPALMAVVYGSLVTLGQALHFLPGLDHFSAPEPCCCCHSHAPHDSGGKHSSESTPEETHDCPICDFLGLSQERPLEIHAPAIGDLVALAPCGEIPLFICEPLRLVSARGPPGPATFAL